MRTKVKSEIKRRSSKIGGKTTITDIARAAGVSTATVSRALNMPDTVSESLREKITHAINQIGYIPSGAARALASNRSFTVGAILPTLDNAIFSASIAAFEQTLSDHNYTLLVTVSNYDHAHETIQLRKLLERGVDAILLVGLDHADPTWKLIEESTLCAIAIWGNATKAKIPCIGFDNAKPAQHAVEHLISLGHQRIGMIAGISKDNDRAKARKRGVITGLKKAGMEIDKNLFIEKEYIHQAGRDGFNELIKQADPPTAILCGNDVLAMGAIFEAQAQSIKVPEDVSIIGYDNLPITRHMQPALTTINVPSPEIGKLAAESVLGLLKHNTPIRSQILKAELLLRATTCPPN